MLAAGPSAASGETAIAFAADQVGTPPAELDFGVSGRGQAGRWLIVRDPSASQGLALEQVSDDPTDDRFDYAVSRSLALKNLIVSTRFRLISGTMKSAGVVFRLRDARNYYVVRANAIEQRVDLFRMTDGALKRVTGTDGDVYMDRWHTLKVVANGDEYAVSLDGIPLFTAWDSSLLSEGSVGLWTQEDNRTHFDQFTVTALPWADGP